MIISKERIKREYQHIVQHESPENAIQWTAEKLGIPASVVKDAINELECEK
ncbi:hypothetical protein ACO0LB_18560 [Undibacterium sp. SXout7W]|uniref:hypothetical protein n=1 Tax=Undibacterium sp. SXout7W TaxID=3413049 RepID=UPI003BF12F44